MKKYVDGFVLVIPKSKVEEYKKMAEEGAKMWMQYGALSYRECMGDDLRPAMSEGTFTFPKMVSLGKDETVWFSYIEYRSKEHRDEVNKKVHEEMERLQKEDPNFSMDMPFDMKRMSFGGFTVEVEA